MALPRLIAITDLERFSAARTLEVVRALCLAARPASVAVQLRAPGQPARAVYELGQELGRAAQASGQYLVVNDRLDLARLLGADGVHLGEASVASADARLLPPFRWIFRACHQPDAVAGLDADALVLSPIFAPRKGAAPLGTVAIERASRLLTARGAGAVYALGGVTPENAGACLSAGAHGVAALGAVFDGVSPERWTRALAISRDSGENGR